MDNELMKKYSDLMGDIDRLTADRDRLIDEQIPDEVKIKIAEIRDEFDARISGLGVVVKVTRNEIEEVVISGKQSVSGGGYSAQFVKGRVKWDEKRLDQLVAQLPAIAECKSVGFPSVRIVKAGSKDE